MLARLTSLALLCTLLIPGRAYGGAFEENSTELLQEYATSINLSDQDNDGQITDMDFSIWVINRVFRKDVPDYNCDEVLDIVDGVLALASELAGLSADFDDSEQVDGLDLGLVVDNLGATDVGADQGDLTGDDVVDSTDVVAVAEKVGQEPSLDPIAVAVSLMQPLLAIDPAVIPDRLPPDDPCPQPEICGNARCKARCYLGDTGVKWTYRLFMIGFCGSQFEADRCCQEATAEACECSPDGFELDCWVTAQGTFIACLLLVP